MESDGFLLSLHMLTEKDFVGSLGVSQSEFTQKFDRLRHKLCTDVNKQLLTDYHHPLSTFQTQSKKCKWTFFKDISSINSLSAKARFQRGEMVQLVNWPLTHYIDHVCWTVTIAWNTLVTAQISLQFAKISPPSNLLCADKQRTWSFTGLQRACVLRQTSTMMISYLQLHISISLLQQFIEKVKLNYSKQIKNKWE